MKHLRENNISYISHLRQAAGYSYVMLKAGFCCAIHAIIPGLFPTTASCLIKDLAKHFNEKDCKKQDPDVI